MQYLVVKELEVLCINERTCQKLDISYGKLFFSLKNCINLRYWITDFYKLLTKKIKNKNKTNKAWNICLFHVNKIYGSELCKTVLCSLTLTIKNVILINCFPFPSHLQYRVWLRSSFRPSPFNDQEQVSALLSQYTEQQQSQKRGGDHSWITVSGYPSMRSNADGDDEGSGWNTSLVMPNLFPSLPGNRQYLLFCTHFQINPQS